MDNDTERRQHVNDEVRQALIDSGFHDLHNDSAILGQVLAFGLLFGVPGIIALITVLNH